MRRRNKGLVEIADEVDCSKSHISGLRSGDRKPSAALAKKFETMIGIPFPSWWDFGDENLYEVLQAIEQHENAQRGFKTRVSGNEVRE